MRQFFKFFFASFLALAIAGILFFIIFFGALGVFSSSLKNTLQGGSGKQFSLKDNSILVIDLSNHFGEQDVYSPLVLFTGGDSYTPGLYTILTEIKNAQTDDKIKGIYLKAEDNGSGLATSQQLRQALKEFKKSGKFIYAYGDMIPQSAYFIASVADSIFINPLGSVELKGLFSQITFYKGAMDKLEIKPEIFYCGKFKSATEPFRMTKMSDPNRIQISQLQKGVWSLFLQAVSEHTGSDTATINQWAQNRTIQTANDAVLHKLADRAIYKDQMEDLLKQKTGVKSDEDLALVSLSDYSSTLKSKDSDKKVALLIAEGEIVDQPSASYNGDPEIAADRFIKQIREVRDEKDIKAVVLRINSPGGSALASEKILRELNLLKKQKPLIVSMGDLAASGGYYISSQADSIFALPTTITGSIGVFGMMFNTEGLFTNKLGITFDEVKNAPYADLGNSNRPMTDQEKVFIQNGVDSIYATFKNRVATGRKRSVNYIDSIGQGRVWSGTMGKRLGLVDRIGNLHRAFQSAAKMAGLTNYQVVVYPKNEPNRLGKIFSILGSSPKAREQMMAQQLLKSQLGDNYSWFKVLQQVKNSQNQVFMMMPFTVKIN